MKALQEIRPYFTHSIPDKLESGLLYINEKDKVASHNCACGCDTKIKLILETDKYKIIKKDGKISVEPTIKNLSSRCKSIYHITQNKVVWR